MFPMSSDEQHGAIIRAPAAAQDSAAIQATDVAELVDGTLVR